MEDVKIGFYENMAFIKTIDVYDNKTILDKINKDKDVQQVGRYLDQVSGVSHTDSCEILDRCVKDHSLCSFYIGELAKTPETRNLSLYAFSQITAELEVSATQKEGVGAKVNLKAPINTSAISNLAEERVAEISNLAEARVADCEKAADHTAAAIKQGAKALISRTKKAGMLAVPPSLIVGNVAAALNSETYPASLDVARHNMSGIEECNSFDSYESVSKRTSKFNKKNFRNNSF